MNSKKDLVGQGKEAHVGSGDIASMPALIPGTTSLTTAAREPRELTDKLVGGGRRWLMLLSELYSDYTASARRVWLNIKQRHYAGERGAARASRGARDAERPWWTMRNKVEKEARARVEERGKGTAREIPRVTAAARVLLRVED